MFSTWYGLWTVPDKVLRKKAFIIPKCLKYDGCQHGLASMVYKLLVVVLKMRILQTNN